MQTRLSLRLSDTERMEVGKAIRAAREARGWSQPELGKRMGVTKSAVNQWESGKNMPDPRKIPDLVKVLALDPRLFVGQDMQIDDVPYRDVSDTLQSGGAPDSAPPEAPPAPYNRGDMPRDVPVLGVTVGGDGGADFSMNGETIDHVRRPPRILGRRDVFALYVQNDSMSPWRESGGIVYVEAARPPQIGDYVVVELTPLKDSDGRPALLKRLVGLSGSKVKLHQFNPPRTFEIERRKVHRLYRVMDWSELLGT